ncbi:MAG: Ca2+/Na+ antiporter [Rhodospirillales bacterium]|jgi:cation:H+ antiporter|nr:Ca2+/Na+ antiporter [Rhodospirillales bacterium]
MALTLILFFGSAVAIYICCEFFVNGVEWVGHRLRITETATGTILAAFGTALPESVVTFVAVAFGNTDAEREIGVGAALGGPLALSTLAYSVVGLTLLGSTRLHVRKKAALEVDCLRLSRDQAWFLSIFLCKLALGVVAFPGKSLFGFVFLAAYGIYVWTELRREGEAHESVALERLKIRPHDDDPSLFWASLQTGAALIVIFVASRVFVGQLDAIGPWLGLPPQLVALLLSPVATEMPETMNAIIWVRQGKERMALANISGAMMIQATIPTACGLFGTPWLFDRSLILAGGVTAVAVVALFLMFRGGRVTGKQLSWSSVLYLLFAGLLLLR